MKRTRLCFVGSRSGYHLVRLWWWWWWYIVALIVLYEVSVSKSFSTKPKSIISSSSLSLSKTSTITQQQLISKLPKYFTPNDLLQHVGSHITSTNDPDLTVTRLVLVRLMKQLISLDNNQNYLNMQQKQQRQIKPFLDEDDYKILSSLNHQQFTSSSRNIRLNLNNSKNNQDVVNLDALVEITKSSSIIARILHHNNHHFIIEPPDANLFQCIGEFWTDQEEYLLPLIMSPKTTTQPSMTSAHDCSSSSSFQPHHISGLHWAFEGFRYVNPSFPCLPPLLQQAYDDLNLPFRIIPGCFTDRAIGVKSLLSSNDNNGSNQQQNKQKEKSYLSLDKLVKDVNFQVDKIRTQTDQIVLERRQTAWEGDEHVSNFLYSDKSMNRDDWSPIVKDVRDKLYKATDIYYDCCLLNLYPEGSSAMRYHIDPDQGTLWGYDTAVVSVGSTRRFAFRPIIINDNEFNFKFNKNSNIDSSIRRAILPNTNNNKTNRNKKKKNNRKKQQTQQQQQQQQLQPHSFHVMHGDVTHMFRDCQEKFQHTVKKAENKNERAARASLVFKQTLRED